MEEKIFLPKLAESIVSAKIVSILKKEKEKVSLDEPIFEVETDKLTTEIPSPVNGVIKEILVKEDQEIQVGDLLAVISVEKEIFLSPAVKALLKKNNILPEDVKKIPVAGDRLSKEDIENYLSSKKRDVKIVELSSVRKAIVKSMVKAHAVPTASLVMEADVTDLLKYIQEKKETFLKKFQVKLTITSFFAKAIALACESFPYMNSSFKEDKIEIKNYINLGIAVERERGLIVPNIKDCNKKSIEEIAKEIAFLAKKVKEDKFDMEDIEDGTITLTNFGMGGAYIGIPVIKYPETAIVGIGIVFEKDKRKKINICLTFDHRVVDGMYSSHFAQEIKRLLKKDVYDQISF